MYATHFQPAGPPQPVISLTGPPLEQQPAQQPQRLLPAFVQEFSPYPSSAQSFASSALPGRP